jgi:hypothetical protein
MMAVAMSGMKKRLAGMLYRKMESKPCHEQEI